MNEELAAYITRLCELSGHTTLEGSGFFGPFVLRGLF